MCGIAAFSIAPGLRVDRHQLVRLCIAGLAERGEDACGWAVRGVDGRISLHKSAVAPDAYLHDASWRIRQDAGYGMVHVRDHTKGRPSLDANNHPIVHGAICGVHNGRIQNDEALFAAHGRARAAPDMTVDSEAIFMLLDALGSGPRAFPELLGSYTAAWSDDRDPDVLRVVRGRGRPLFVGITDGLVLAASTRHALQFIQYRLRLRLQIDCVPIDTLLTLADGVVVAQQRIVTQPFTESPTTMYDADYPHAQRARAIVGTEPASDLLLDASPEQ